ncbi:MAG: type II toxin-antitoxin system Phd/YefM family antitoxin [Firmicutes bacterium]|nr:type II toxin-antitoxin system Phd/YefM family antitoxin [Bacillota bacterium]
MSKVVPAAILRDHLADAIKEVSKKEKYLLITNKGRPVSALVNLDFFEDLLALSSPKYLKSIKEARENYKKGQFFSHEEVFGAL